MSEPQVEPNFRDVDECGCGCGAYGTLKPPSKDGTRCVSRKCKCVRCRNRRNRKSGLDKQRKAAVALGLADGKFLASNEENWSDAYFANEVKSGKQVGPVLNWWLRVEKQVKANQADYGDRLRPVRAVAMPDGWGKDGLVVVRLSTWREHIGPALDEFWGQTS